MELFKGHMSDTIPYEKYIGVDMANQREFEPVVDLPCRVVEIHSIVKLSSEEEVVSNKTIYTTQRIGEMDRLDGNDVLYVRQYKTLLDKEVWGYEVRI